DEARDGFVVRPWLAGRRHEPRTELMNYRFPLRALRGGIQEVRILEHEVGFAFRSAVAVRAVLAQRRAMLGGQFLRRRRAGCQRRRGKRWRDATLQRTAPHRAAVLRSSL